MKNQFGFLIVLLILFSISLSSYISCGDDDDDDGDDDDDDDGDDDDDDNDDDDNDNDDDTAVDLCKEAFTFLTVDCGFVFIDTEGFDLNLDDLFDICESGFGDACIINCYDSYDTCDDMGTCIDACFSDK